MLGAMELGQRVGRRRRVADPEHSHAGVGPVEGAVFGLLGLLLAFMFSGAWSRFDARRDLIVKEANSIGTAWLRLDLLPADETQDLRTDFRRYVILRLALTRVGATAPSAEITTVQQRIWVRATALAKASSDPRVVSLLLPPLNEVFDLATTRHVAAGTHPPGVVFTVLIALAAAALAGDGMAPNQRRGWLPIACFVGRRLAASYVAFEMEYPRRGLLRVERSGQLPVALRDSLKQAGDDQRVIRAG